MFYNFFKVVIEDLSSLKKYAILLGLKIGTRLIITHFFYLLRVFILLVATHYNVFWAEINLSIYQKKNRVNK